MMCCWVFVPQHFEGLKKCHSAIEIENTIDFFETPGNPKLAVQCYIPEDLNISDLSSAWIRLCRCLASNAN